MSGRGRAFATAKGALHFGRREGNRAPRTPSFKKNRHNLLAFATGKAGSGGRAGPLRISLLPLVFLSTGRVRHDDDFPRSQRTALPRSPARSLTSAAVEGRVWVAWDHPGAANHRGAATEKECNPERSSFSARRRIAVSDALFAHLYLPGQRKKRKTRGGRYPAAAPS